MKRLIQRRIWGVLLLLTATFLMGCEMSIQHGLTEREANEIIVLLSKASPSIDANKLKDESGREVRWNIVVSKSDAPRAIAMLQENNLPRRKEKGLKELYSETGMIPTATQERARYIMALSGELNRTLKKIKGVLKASVHLAIPKEKQIKQPGEKTPQPRASVLLIVTPEDFKTAQLKANLTNSVKMLVSGTHAKLNKNNIDVVVSYGGAASVMKAASPAAGTGSGPALKKVLFVKVAPADAMKLRMFMFGGFGIIGILLVITVLLFFRASSLKQQLNANGY